MRKSQELMLVKSSDPKCCLGKAHEDEMIFVLLGRDVAAPSVIRFWAFERIRLGKNTADDPQIKEALQCTNAMELERSGLLYFLGR